MQWISFRLQNVEDYQTDNIENFLSDNNKDDASVSVDLNCNNKANKIILAHLRLQIYSHANENRR